MIGAFSYGWLNQRMSRRAIVYAALFGSALTYIPIALLPPIGLFIAFAFLCGLTWGPMQPLLTTIVQLRVDPDAQGRVFGIQTATFYVAPPAAMFLAGVLAENFGVKPVLLGIAALLLITALGVLRVKSLRDIDSDSVG
jgi:DHA3 family macrolide efflux protein-like MFS transporter